MGYKCLQNVRVAGHQYKIGDSYVGPENRVDELLKAKLIASDKDVKEQPGSQEPVSPRAGFTAPQKDEELDLVSDSKKKKGKGK